MLEVISNKVIVNKISKIPMLSRLDFKDLEIEPLLGLSNKNYRISDQNKHYVLRLPIESSNTFINRENEAHNADIIFKLGIAPECLWREKGDDGHFTGASLTTFITQGRPSTAADLQKPKHLNALAEILNTLHQSQQQFKGVLDKEKIADLLEKYYQLVNHKQQQTLANDYKKAQQLLKNMGEDNHPLVPSHIDLCPDNIIYATLQRETDAHPPTSSEFKVWLIDWEYSAMASPYWDIASLLNSAELDIKKHSQAQAFVKAVLPQCNNDSENDNFEKTAQYQFIVKIVNDLWTLMFWNIVF